MDRLGALEILCASSTAGLSSRRQGCADMVKDAKVVVTCEFCSSVHAAGSPRGVGGVLCIRARHSARSRPLTDSRLSQSAAIGVADMNFVIRKQHSARLLVFSVDDFAAQAA